MAETSGTLDDLLGNVDSVEAERSLHVYQLQEQFVVKVNETLVYRALALSVTDQMQPYFTIATRDATPYTGVLVLQEKSEIRTDIILKYPITRWALQGSKGLQCVDIVKKNGVTLLLDRGFAKGPSVHKWYRLHQPTLWLYLCGAIMWDNIKSPLRAFSHLVSQTIKSLIALKVTLYDGPYAESSSQKVDFIDLDVSVQLKDRHTRTITSRSVIPYKGCVVLQHAKCVYHVDDVSRGTRLQLAGPGIRMYVTCIAEGRYCVEIILLQ